MVPVIITISAVLSAALVAWLAVAIRGWSAKVRAAEAVVSDPRPRQSKRFPELLVRGVFLLASGYTAYYLAWRLSTLNPEAAWFSWLRWGAEAYRFLSLALFVFMAWKLVFPPRTPAPEGVAVDVFVPTRSEPLDILRATLVACRYIRYSHRTYVLDDSARPEVAALAAELGADYIAPPGREGAKAGNLNYALRRTHRARGVGRGHLLGAGQRGAPRRRRGPAGQGQPARPVPLSGGHRD